MKNLFLIIFICCFGCVKYDPHSQAVISMVNRGYDLTDVNLFTEVIRVTDNANLPGNKIGWYDPETRFIFLKEKAGYDVEWHEWMHYLLREKQVDIGQHHKIINN